MANGLDVEVERTLVDLTAARQSFLEAVGIAADSSPAPASAEDVDRLENLLGRRLPPSYCSFLRIQNGFPELDGEINVLCIDDMISFIDKGASELLAKIANASREDFIHRCIVFGMSEKSTSAFLFDPEQRSGADEWAVVEYDEEDGIGTVHENFLLFLRESAKEAREAEQETLQGQDLLDLDF